jgi:hypothetical protein
MSGACQVHCCFKVACDVTDFQASDNPDRYEFKSQLVSEKEDCLFAR